MNGRSRRIKGAERERNQRPAAQARNPFGGLCPNGCGAPGPHYVPPSLGDRGFFLCQPEETR